MWQTLSWGSDLLHGSVCARVFLAQLKRQQSCRAPALCLCCEAQCVTEKSGTASPGSTSPSLCRAAPGREALGEVTFLWLSFFFEAPSSRFPRLDGAEQPGLEEAALAHPNEMIFKVPLNPNQSGIL